MFPTDELEECRLGRSKTTGSLVDDLSVIRGKSKKVANAGGISTSISYIANAVKAKVKIYSGPAEGRKAILSRGTEKVTLTLHWRFDDWWWDF